MTPPPAAATSRAAVPVPLDGGDRVLTLSGHWVQIRPIRPGDRARVAAVVGELSERSRYQRFLSVRSELSAEQLEFFTEVDHVDHEALVANDLTTGVTLAIARYIRGPEGPRTAEVAVIVLDRWQHTGLGAALLEDLAVRAHLVGIERFTAEVLATNAGMFALLGRLGDLHTHHEGGTVAATVELRAAHPRAVGIPTA